MNHPTPKQRANRAGFGAVVDRVAVNIGLARGLTKEDSYAVIEAFAEELFATLRRTRRITWPRRGTFRVTQRKARDVANPQTGEKMRLPPSVGIGFRAAKVEKARLSEST